MRILLLSWLFFIPICWILLGVEMDVVSGRCLNDQRALLLQLKNNLRFNANASKLAKWNESSDCGTWEGVTFDNEGRAIGLNLSSESISGGIDELSSLFDLQYVRSLDLSYNKLNSPISSRFGNLTTLTYLNLSNAGFWGQIPKEISRLTSLVTLDLSTLSLLQISSLKLENPNLRMLVQNLLKLEDLHLDGVNISASGSEWCQALSSSLPNLRVLSLTNCYLSGPLDHSLEKLRSLKVIRLDSNNLSASVPEFFANFSNLTSLSLSSCGLYGTFPEKIFQVPTLQNIDISYNQLLHGYLPEVQKNHGLQRLLLRSTNFSGSLPTSIGNLGNLSKLDLSNCEFEGVLPSSMEKLTQLVYLDLSVNKFNGSVPSFKMIKNLANLVLSHNSLTGAISLADWEGLVKLLVVDLRNNLLNGSIPSSLFTLPSLKQIQFSQNKFSGQLPEFVNASSSTLETLDISSNNLEGPIPMSIFEHRKLTILSLSSNNLNGTIPLDMIHGLDNLTTLDLSYNNLSLIANGNSTWSLFPKISRLNLASCKLKVFPYLKNQVKLVYLDLSNNQIHGKIPNWIWEAGNGSLFHLNLSHNYLVGIQEPYSPPRSLNVLDLHVNHLQGRTPILPTLASYIDLSRNNFTSSIPVDIGKNLPVTIFFSISNNNITGDVPESICKAYSIQVLDMSDNNLGGTLPECMSTMSPYLGVLNLRRNNFTGRIPDAFPAGCGLKTLDLNENSIEGQIPNSLANCTELEVLNLGNNELSDKFPCMLKKISTLRVVVLRSNRFYGSIGCPHINGTWKTLQIVDLAHNNFSGRLPGECLTKWQDMLDYENDSQTEHNHLNFEILQFTQVFYQDAIRVTSKGLEMELVKILTVFAAIDLSSNHFVGPIPREVGLLKALYALNLSNNALTGEIPSSIGNLTELESLDLSRNNLSGPIPQSLQNLNFLSFLNLSCNELVGMIPTGSQLQTFSADSYIENEGLCGFPLTVKCSDPSNATENVVSEPEFDWQSIYTGIGFGVGAGAVFALLMFWEEGRNWLEDSIDKILLVILPMMGYSYKARHEWDDEDNEDQGSEFAEDHEEDEMEDGELQGRYCVFCSKLDISIKWVIHDPRCTCHSPPMSSSLSSTSSSSST